MEIDGEQLIKVICERLNVKDVRMYDSEIVNEIIKLTSGQLNQIVSFGNVTQWHHANIMKGDK